MRSGLRRGGRRFATAPRNGRTNPTSSSTIRTARSGAGSPPPRSSPRSRRALRWFRCPVTPAATPAWPSMPAIAGCCTPATRSITTAPSTGHPVPRALTAMESLVAFDRKTVLANHARLAELYQRKDPDLLIVCAHDPTLLEQARATAYDDAFRAPTRPCRRSRAPPGCGGPHRLWRTAPRRGRRA